MINSTSGVKYSLATSPYIDEAYLITSPAGQWSNFVVERGRKMFAGDVRVRNTFNNKCLTSDGTVEPTFEQCRGSNADQVSPRLSRIQRPKADPAVLALQYYTLGGPEPARPPPRVIRPSMRADLCLQLGDEDYLGNNSANLLVL